ncbi:MAG: NAD(P)/FAD-dependent oxidoreductase, partial [Proteobacteria bacterium]|nr:NAD(P)/FAD-dependent oxidoreductase [Pseudomonadota bacterium]
MENKPDGAILQRDGKTWAIVPRTPVGLVTADILEAIARTIRKYDIPVAKITSGQRVALVGLTEEQLDGAWAELGTDIGRATELCLHYVQACPGTAVCKLGLRDSLGLGLELEQAFMGMELPAKVKIGVSGCPMCCGESKVRDVGFIGKKDGWEMYVGGSAAGRPRIAD